jgi:uncharacterized protein with beta-barrel porin domain
VQAITGEVRGVRPPRRRASILKALLASSALVNAGVAGFAFASTLSLVAVVASTSIARADGGRGGDSDPNTGGAGGAGNSGAAGGNGTTDTLGTFPGIAGGGGGGGAGGGGAGGTGGGASAGPGGAGGTAVSPNGGNGSAIGVGAGGGGGGGFNGAVAGNGGNGGSSNSPITFVGNGLVTGSAGGGGGGGGSGLGTGGAGGAGGAGSDTIGGSPSAGASVSATVGGGGGGSGGDGGIGNVQAGSGLTLTSASNGGVGGAGGAGGSATANMTATDAGATANATAVGGNGGNGGSGGAGLQFSGAGSFTINADVSGGQGNFGGAGGSAAPNATANGAGSQAIAKGTGGNGGAGGSGGAGLVMTGSNINVVGNHTTAGGDGGFGGNGGDVNASATSTGGIAETIGASGTGGNGGAGGAGAVFTGSGVTFTNNVVTQGGNGGNGGASGGFTFTLNGGIANSGSASGIGGNGGAGGVGVSLAGANSTLNNTGSINGGAGGSGAASATAGAGGAGGGAVSFGASGATLHNSGTITGGNGGNADSTGNGLGGGGGFAVSFTGANATIINTGSIIGGNDGHNGSSFAGTEFLTGTAISGSGLTINNDGGTISGGFDSSGTFRGSAIAFNGGANAISTGGTINGSVFLQGGASLSVGLPGSTVGPTLNVNGDLFMNPNAVYNVRVNGAANDSITASGVANIELAKVSATISGGSSAIGQHTIITAGGGFFGGFTSLSVSSNSAFLQESLSHDLTHAYLNVTGNGANGAIDFTTAAQTTNQLNVASALNSAGNANGFSGPLLNLILNLSASQARTAFTALDGETATGAQRAAFRFGDQFLNLMLNPFVEGRFGNAGGGVTGFAPEEQANLPPEMAQAYAKVFKAAPQPANFEQRWSIWNAAFGGSGKTSGDPVVVGSTDTRLSTYGVAGGIDYRFSPYTVVGLAAAGGGTNWNLDNALGGGRSDSAQVGAYAKTRIGPAYIAESISFASHWFSTNRTALGDNLRATFTGESIGGRIEGGYRFAVGQTFGITPYAAGQAQAFHSGAYSETDVNNLGFGLAYAAKDTTDVRTELGARFDNPTLVNGMPLIVRARLAWAHDFVDTPSLGAAFQTLPLSNFTVFGAAIPHDSALASLGVDWYLNKDWKLLAKFDGEFATRSEIYAGTVALRYSW